MSSLPSLFTPLLYITFVFFRLKESGNKHTTTTPTTFCHGLSLKVILGKRWRTVFQHCHLRLGSSEEEGSGLLICLHPHPRPDSARLEPPSLAAPLSSPEVLRSCNSSCSPSFSQEGRKTEGEEGCIGPPLTHHGTMGRSQMILLASAFPSLKWG